MYVVENGRARRTIVKLGHQTGQEAEVSGGLSDGDRSCCILAIRSRAARESASGPRAEVESKRTGLPLRLERPPAHSRGVTSQPATNPRAAAPINGLSGWK